MCKYDLYFVSAFVVFLFRRSHCKTRFLRVMLNKVWWDRSRIVDEVTILSRTNMVTILVVAVDSR